jgi:photosystem II stability/assembly factor-like uncharacterized protein
MAGAVGRLLGVAAAALILGACGGDERQSAPPPPPWLDPHGEAPVVGSLAVNPADSALWMATNTGLFRVRGGAPQRVTGTLRQERISAQLVIRFTGPDQLLASGHPASGGALPEALGLIRSDDAGRTWNSVSEFGTADFHAIERSGDRLVGGLSGQAQVQVSADDGATWQSRMAPGVLSDLEVDPTDHRRWIASTAEGLFLTTDEGATWRPTAPTPHADFAWPSAEALYRLDPGGEVLLSRDRGREFEHVGSTGGEPQALVAADPMTLYALLLDGRVLRSGDGGRTWEDYVAT